jgi:hypothetical protein
MPGLPAGVSRRPEPPGEQPLNSRRLTEKPMRKLATLAVVVGGLAFSAPVAAQYTYGPPGQPPPPPEVRNHVLRVNLGVSFFSAAWYTCNYGYSYSGCTSGYFTSTVPFLVGPQVDLDLGGGMNSISAGVTVTFGKTSNDYYSADLQQLKISTSYTMWEPTLDYVGKFGPPTEDTVGRIRIGGGVYIGQHGKAGGALRLGGGLSLLNTHRFGIGLDVVLEGGIFGSLVGGIQLMASPEFHF